MRVVVIGAGPTGLGAAWRLHELGVDHWELLEAEEYPGGLAASFRDARGFTWDIGGHVQFSHYDYFDRVMATLLGPHEWIHHERQSWIWMRERFIPYPLQHNVHRLPAADLARCLEGLPRLAERRTERAANFRDWALAHFGDGLWEVFLGPYNQKVWAHPPETLSCSWVGDRVAEVDLEQIRRSVALGRDDARWGANRTFQYPRSGGTGAIWRRCAKRIPAGRLQFGERIVRIDAERRCVHSATGAERPYTHLISTMPLPSLLALCGDHERAAAAARNLPAATTHVIGVGLRGTPAENLLTKNWIYFPEARYPFHRVTVFSNYAPSNVPGPPAHWSLLCETSESARRPVDTAMMLDRTLDGLAAARLLPRGAEVVSLWQHTAPFGYPVPGLGRDGTLAAILPALERKEIYSRGRFGAWLYEVSNQDHCFMQGVEVVDRIVDGRAEDTIVQPERVNRERPPDRSPAR